MDHEISPSVRGRVSVGAVVAGALVELVTLGLLLMLSGGLGLWSMRPLDAALVRELGVGLGLFVGASWIASACVGGYTASVIARATHRRDGILHGMLSWAIACATAAVLLCVWFMSALAADLANVDVVSAMDGPFMFAFVVGDVLALAGALAGGVAGARAESRLATPTQPLVQASVNPAPTTLA